MPIDPVTLTTVAARPTVVVATATTWREFPRLWPQLLDEVYAVLRPAPPGLAPTTGQRDRADPRALATEVSYLLASADGR